MEKSKTIDIGDRQFIMRVPGPWDGCAMFDMLVEYKAPFVPNILFGIKANRKTMPPETLKEFMKICLANTFEIILDKKINVIDEDGGIGINDSSGPLFTKLTSQYILFFTEYWQDGKA